MHNNCSIAYSCIMSTACFHHYQMVQSMILYIQHLSSGTNETVDNQNSGDSLKVKIPHTMLCFL